MRPRGQLHDNCVTGLLSLPGNGSPGEPDGTQVVVLPYLDLLLELILRQVRVEQRREPRRQAPGRLGRRGRSSFVALDCAEDVPLPKDLVSKRFA